MPTKAQTALTAPTAAQVRTAKPELHFYLADATAAHPNALYLRAVFTDDQGNRVVTETNLETADRDGSGLPTGTFTVVGGAGLSVAQATNIRNYLAQTIYPAILATNGYV